MKRSNMRWAKFAAGARAGLGMLAACAACPALASEIQSVTIDPIGTLVPGHTGVTITGKVVCDVTGTVDLEFVLVTQTKKKTQFGFASTVPDAAIPCGPFVTSWTATAVIDFSKSALLHKGKASVQVQFDDAIPPIPGCIVDTFPCDPCPFGSGGICFGGTPGTPGDDHLATAFVFLQ